VTSQASPTHGIRLAIVTLPEANQGFVNRHYRGKVRTAPMRERLSVPAKTNSDLPTNIWSFEKTPSAVPTSEAHAGSVQSQAIQSFNAILCYVLFPMIPGRYPELA
jgi:hypothetical protein